MSNDMNHHDMDHDKILYHTIPPIFSPSSKVLILGTFPSPKSREVSFFYGHPRNRFWPVLARIFNTNVPETVEDKKKFLLNRHIALWDVVASCSIQNADDASIRNCKPNDLSVILSVADIKAVFTTGSKAYQLYNRLCLKKTNIPAKPLPSTSPANAKFSLEKLVDEYRVILKYLR
jgi:TDG/mug DNA glycosylase family protein